MVDSLDASNRPQFGIRHLLLAMVVVAILATLAAPMLRDWSAGQWFRWTIHWVSFTAAILFRWHVIQRRWPPASWELEPSPAEIPVVSWTAVWGWIRIANETVRHRLIRGRIFLLILLGMVEGMIAFVVVDKPQSPIWVFVLLGICLGVFPTSYCQIRRPCCLTVDATGVVFRGRHVSWDSLRLSLSDTLGGHRIEVALPGRVVIELSPSPESQRLIIELLTRASCRESDAETRTADAAAIREPSQA